MAVAESIDSGDVLRAYDPYNTGMYKGIKVSKEVPSIEVNRVADIFVVSVSFISFYTIIIED